MNGVSLRLSELAAEQKKKKKNLIGLRWDTNDISQEETRAP